MSYVKAEEVLPKHLLEEIQQYVDGKLLYVPRKGENSLSWGEKSGTREKLAERNQTIVSRYYSGETVGNLSKAYYLSEKRIQGIVREYESSQKKQGGKSSAHNSGWALSSGKQGGFKNE